MIYTGSHSNWKSNTTIKTYAISGNRGKDADYFGPCFEELAPKKDFWKIWHDGVGKVPEVENNKYYIQEYWYEVLNKLDPKKVYEQLDNSVLLCYESNDKFCHRHIVAAWFELMLGVTVPEAKPNGSTVEILNRPEYIKEYLKKVMLS